jgi:prepilin-type N-terminal cleavage/methylation domain-containing protein
MTLLELIVVIVILGILAAIAIPTFLKVIQNSKDASSTETANSLSHDATALAAFAGKGAVSLAANGNSYVYNAAKSDLTSYNFHNAVSGATNDADYPASGTTKGTITEVTTSTWNISVGDPGESCLTATTSVDVVAVATSGSCADYVEIPFGGSGSTTTATGGSTTTTTTPPTALAGLYPSDADTNSPMALNGVACPSEGHCVAVGNYVTAGNAYPLIDTLSGDSWTATTAPLPTNADADGQSASLESISCAADSTCVAVGEYVVGGVQAGLIATFTELSVLESQPQATVPEE